MGKLRRYCFGVVCAGVLLVLRALAMDYRPDCFFCCDWVVILFCDCFAMCVLLCGSSLAAGKITETIQHDLPVDIALQWLTTKLTANEQSI